MKYQQIGQRYIGQYAYMGWKTAALSLLMFEKMGDKKHGLNLTLPAPQKQNKKNSKGATTAKDVVH